jgi:hypothetical protein
MQDQEESSTYVTYGAYLRVPVPKKVGVPATYTVTVEYLGEHQYKRSYEQRVKAHAKSQERIKKWKEEQAKKEIERQEQQLIQRRTRIMNQIELAFVKNGKDAVNFVTCDKCEATAKFLGLAYENPGGDVIDPDQITGAWCQEHDNKHQRPFKTTAAIACERLEFFYDGLRQLYVKSSADHTAVQVGSRGC